MQFLFGVPKTKFLIGMKEPNGCMGGQAPRLWAGQLTKFSARSFPSLWKRLKVPTNGKENFGKSNETGVRSWLPAAGRHCGTTRGNQRVGLKSIPTLLPASGLKKPPGTLVRESSACRTRNAAGLLEDCTTV